jgi:hypothetical protein
MRGYEWEFTRAVSASQHASRSCRSCTPVLVVLDHRWVISKHPAHAALVSEADLTAAQDTAAMRGQAGQAVRRYLLAGLLACGRCGRRLESASSNSKPAYRWPPRPHQRDPHRTRTAPEHLRA